MVSMRRLRALLMFVVIPGLTLMFLGLQVRWMILSPRSSTSSNNQSHGEPPRSLSSKKDDRDLKLIGIQQSLMRGRGGGQYTKYGGSQNVPRGREHPDSKVVYLLHIHKSAGTALCDLARANQWHVSRHNCNVQLDQRCCGNEDSVEAQRNFAADTRYDLVANERQMYEAMDIQSYRYICVLRDSRERYFSHWRHVLRNQGEDSPVSQLISLQVDMEAVRRREKWREEDNSNTNTDNNNNLSEPPLRPSHGGHPAEDWETVMADRSLFNVPISVGKSFADWWMAQPDNWNVRQLCGTRCMGRPKYQLTRDDWIYTLQRLVQFDTILVLNYDFEKSLDNFAARVGWTVTDLQEASVNDNDNPDHADPQERLAEIRQHRDQQDINFDGGLSYLTSLFRGGNNKRKLPKKKEKKKTTAVDPKEMEDWDPMMSALDDALLDISQRLEVHKQTIGLDHDALLNPKDQQVQAFLDTTSLRHSLQDKLRTYLDENDASMMNRRNQCINECCAARCSAW